MNLHNERLGSGKTDTGDAYHPGPVEEAIVAVTRKCVTKVLQRSEAKPDGSTLPANCKLSGKLSPKTKAEKAEMMKVPYASVVGSLMYAMVCTRPDIGYAVGVVSRFMSNPGKEHLEHGQVDTSVPEGHFEHVPPIWLR